MNINSSGDVGLAVMKNPVKNPNQGQRVKENIADYIKMYIYDQRSGNVPSHPGCLAVIPP